jgi:hypothetical protein
MTVTIIKGMISLRPSFINMYIVACHSSSARNVPKVTNEFCKVSKFKKGLEPSDNFERGSISSPIVLS